MAASRRSEVEEAKHSGASINYAGIMRIEWGMNVSANSVEGLSC